MMTMSSMVETSKEPINYQGYFGDKRLEARGTILLANLIAKGTVILNQLAANRAKLVGASRFFDHAKVSVEPLVQEATTRCQPNVVGLNLLAIQDTSEINYSDIHLFLYPTYTVELPQPSVRWG